MSDDVPPLRLHWVDPELLDPHPNNPNEGDVGAVYELIVEHGFVDPVLAYPIGDTGRWRIIDGEHRWRAFTAARADPAVESVASDAPIAVIEKAEGVSDARALRLLAGLNRTSRLGRDRPGDLAELLQQIVDAEGSLAGTAYSDDDLDDLLADIAATESTDLGEIVADGMTPAERRAAYEAHQIRSFILPFPAADYDRIAGVLALLRTALGIDTNAELVVRLADDRLAEIEATA
jgi:ParB-like chromosome segregation protein Spo0J